MARTPLVPVHIERRVGDLPVLRPDGERMRLGDVWATQPVVIALLRHFGCIFCKEQVARLREIVEDIHGAGGELVVKDRQFAVALKDVDIDLPSGATVRLDLGKMEVANMLATPQIASFTFQVVYNITMSAGLAPVKGLTLPLMSYGGSSMIATLAAFGLVLNVRMRRFTN